MDADVEAGDILANIRKEIDGFNTLEKDLSSHVRSCTSSDSQGKAQTLLFKVRKLSKWASILNEKITEHCQSKGLAARAAPTESISVNTNSISDLQIPVIDEAVANTVASAPQKKSSKKIPSIRQFSIQDLQLVPSYMKGRLTTKNINDLIEKFNTAIQTKYTLLKKPKNHLTSREKQHVIAFKNQETKLAKGNHFCIAEDLKVFCNYNFINSTWSVITILRHCKLIKEIREPKLPIKYAIVEEDW